MKTKKLLIALFLAFTGSFGLLQAQTALYRGGAEETETNDATAEMLADEEMEMWDADFWYDLDEVIEESLGTPNTEDDEWLEVAFESDWSNDEFEDNDYQELMNLYPSEDEGFGYDSDEDLYLMAWDFNEEDDFGDLIEEIDLDYPEELFME